MTSDDLRIALVVENDPFVLASTARALDGAGYIVFSAPNRTAASDLADALPQLSLAVAGCQLPDGLGIETVASLAERWPAIQSVVVLPAGVEAVERLQQVSNLRVLSRPFDRSHLLAAVAELGAHHAGPPGGTPPPRARSTPG